MFFLCSFFDANMISMTEIDRKTPTKGRGAVTNAVGRFEAHDRVTVEALATNTPSSETSIADQRGVTGWNFDLPPGEQKDIRFGWRLKWPADREIRLSGNAPMQAFRFGGTKF